MASATVRIDVETLAKLRTLATSSGVPMPTVLRHAVDAYERALFLEGLNRDFAVLKADADAWAEEESERGDWEATLADDLDDDPAD